MVKRDYKRMSWNGIAPTITLNSGTVSSDNKIHPTQHRSLSILELLMISTVHSNSAELPWEGKYSFDPFVNKKELLKLNFFSFEIINYKIILFLNIYLITCACNTD